MSTARAWRIVAAVETARASLNATTSGGDNNGGNGGSSGAAASALDPDIAAAMGEAALAAAAMGDAATAFAAAALAVGATGGGDLSPLVNLCRVGAASPGGDGGFPSLERDVATKLAEGPVKQACMAALRWGFTSRLQFTHSLKVPGDPTLEPIR